MHSTEQNRLFPIFLKAGELDMLIVGGGEVALEKLTFLLKSSPDARVKILAPEIRDEILDLCRRYNLVKIQERYAVDFLNNTDVVIAATNDSLVNLQIYKDCKSRRILVNVPDTPEICDFYLGGIVTKGHLKIAISTNGKSPTLAKRLRQLFEEVFPENINELLINLHTYRKTLKLDFKEKVDHLNEITKKMIEQT